MGCLFAGAHTYLHCALFPIVLLLIHNWLLTRFRRRHGRTPEDTFLRWGRGFGPDYAYNTVVGIVAFVGPMLGGVLLPKLAHQ